jgi:hypothetical protein
VVGRRPGFSYDTWSSGLHGVLMFFAACSVAGASSVVKCSTAADVSGVPVMRNARPKARRRIAARRHCGLGCSQAPRPGRLPAVSTVTAYSPFPVDTATTRSSSTASSRLRHPIQVRTGPASEVEVSRWITAQSTVITSTVEPECLLLHAHSGSSATARALADPVVPRCRCGCRCASPSGGPPTWRFAPLCQ